MKIGVLGTGTVGQTIATKLVELGHEVMLGSRTANNEKAVAWAKATGKGAATGSFEQVGAGSDIVFNCTLGSGALEALHMAKESNLAGKIVVDVSNPLDSSMPCSSCPTPTRSASRFSAFSGGEGRPHPQLCGVTHGESPDAARRPRRLLSGNDAAAKTTVGVFSNHSAGVTKSSSTSRHHLRPWYGELLPLWLRIWHDVSGAFNPKLVFAWLF
jgi:predicted dinucleotide-binding enzyme